MSYNRDSDDGGEGLTLSVRLLKVCAGVSMCRAPYSAVLQQVHSAVLSLTLDKEPSYVHRKPMLCSYVG